MNIKKVLEENPDLQEQLFMRGYLITEGKRYDVDKFPFYGKWKETEIDGYFVYVHQKQHFVMQSEGNAVFFLIGNCLNPFDGIYDESLILEKALKKYRQSKNEFIKYINELTGDFLLCMLVNGAFSFISDPCGMLFGCYGKAGGFFHISSHAQLIADLYPLHKSDYIKRFEKYPYFYQYGVFFPGDLTQYEELTRVVQNHIHYYDGSVVRIERFYPLQALETTRDEKAYKKLVENVCDILKNTMKLAGEKWGNAAVSLTGGMDSKTTLACTNGHYDQFKYYSYVSMQGDKIDADAARIISKCVGIPHEVYTISEDDSDFDRLKIHREILQHNNGGYRVNPNDVRKRAYFAINCPFEVEIKSWCSEIARANYYKKFGLREMPKHLSQRNMTSMFKVFTTQRRLAKETDQVFKDYIQKTKFNEMPDGYDESDMYLWEFRYSAWGGMVITLEHSYSNEIFIPFNNRKLLDLMLRAPKQKRITDQFHEDLIKHGNHKVDEAGITITNWNETKKRMYVEKAYFVLSSLLGRFGL